MKERRKVMIDVAMRQVVSLRAELGLMLQASHRVLFSAILVGSSGALFQHVQLTAAHWPAVSFGLSQLLIALLVGALAMYMNGAAHTAHLHLMEERVNNLIGHPTLTWERKSSSLLDWPLIESFPDGLLVAGAAVGYGWLLLFHSGAIPAPVRWLLFVVELILPIVALVVFRRQIEERNAKLRETWVDAPKTAPADAPDPAA